MIAPLLAALLGTIVVQPGGPVRTLTEALALAHPGDRIVVRAGSYREPRIVVGLPLTIEGEGSPVFLGGAHSTLEVTADGVTIRGLVFSGVTESSMEDRAAILVNGAHDCRIEDNRISYGCINIPVEFYEAYVRPAYAHRNAVVYVLPDVKPLDQVFPLGDDATLGELQHPALNAGLALR